MKNIRRLMDIPEIKESKHSSLDRMIELERLALRDAHRPDFRIYTGNDLGINMMSTVRLFAGTRDVRAGEIRRARRLWKR